MKSAETARFFSRLDSSSVVLIASTPPRERVPSVARVAQPARPANRILRFIHGEARNTPNATPA